MNLLLTFFTLLLFYIQIASAMDKNAIEEKLLPTDNTTIDSLTLAVQNTELNVPLSTKLDREISADSATLQHLQLMYGQVVNLENIALLFNNEEMLDQMNLARNDIIAQLKILEANLAQHKRDLEKLKADSLLSEKCDAN